MLVTRLSLLTLGLVVFLRLSLYGQLAVSIFAVLCLLNAVLLIHKKDNYTVLCFLLGFFLSLAPLLGSGTLLLLAVLYIVFDKNLLSLTALEWATPITVALFSWVVAQWVFGFDAKTLISILQVHGRFSSQGLQDLMQYLRNAAPDFIVSTEAILRFLVMLIIFSIFSIDEARRTVFARGFLLGLIPAAGLVLHQIYGEPNIAFPNQIDFWTGQGRYTGSFSDPNAFGIFVVLLVPFLFMKAVDTKESALQWVYFLFSLLWLALSLYSGSRSLFIGFGLYFLYFLYLCGFRFLLAGLLLGLGLVLALNHEGSIAVIPSLALPAGMKRVLDSLVWTNINETFFSRFAFFQIAAAIFRDSFVFGVGYNHFSQYVVPYAAKLNLGTGMWIDNANNYYMGLLAETGLYGLLTLLASLRHLSWKLSSSLILRAAVLCFAVLLFLGPHIYFDEIAILFAFIASFVLEVRGRHRIGAHWGVIALSFFTLIMFSSYYNVKGFYPWEKDSEYYFRWTATKASGYLSCDENGKAQLLIRALNPDLEQRHLEFEVSTNFEAPKRLVLDSSEIKQINLHCKTFLDKQKLTEQLHTRLFYNISVSRTWIPSRHGVGSDPRPLGVQVLFKNPIDAL